MDERMKEELEHYIKHSGKMEEIAHIWERCAKDFAQIAEERKQISHELKLSLLLWITLGLFEAVVILILTILK